MREPEFEGALDGAYRVETPENVEVLFDLAGPGSRFCALLIDSMLIWLAVFVLVIATALVGVGWGLLLREGGPDGEGSWFTWVNAAVLAVVMVLIFGYHAFFELVLRGQTPGKRSMKIRVIRDDGTPAAPGEIIIRNLVRVVDFLPGMYGVGGVVSLFHPQHKRLGDLAAGTIVVKESEVDYRAASDKKPALGAAPADVVNPALTAEERRLLRGFLQRRVELLPDARRALAARLAQTMHAKHGGALVDAELYLERLAGGREHEC